MTEYRRRLEAGIHTSTGNDVPMGTITTRKLEDMQTPTTTTPPETELAAPKETKPVADPEEATLKELQAQAEALGLPTYGTKAQLAERIANA